MSLTDFERNGTMTSQRESVVSGVTVDLDRSNDDILNPEDLNDDELQIAVDSLQKRTRILRLENEMMIRYLVRNAQFDGDQVRQQLERLGERMLELEHGRRSRSSIDGRGIRQGLRKSPRAHGGPKKTGSIGSAESDTNLTLEQELQKKLIKSVIPGEKGEKPLEEEIKDKLLDTVAPKKGGGTLQEEVQDKLVYAVIPEEIQEEIQGKLLDAVVPKEGEGSLHEEIQDQLLDAAVPQEGKGSLKEEIQEKIVDAAVPKKGGGKLQEEMQDIIVDAAIPKGDEKLEKDLQKDIVEAVVPDKEGSGSSGSSTDTTSETSSKDKLGEEGEEGAKKSKKRHKKSKDGRTEEEKRAEAEAAGAALIGDAAAGAVVAEATGMTAAAAEAVVAVATMIGAATDPERPLVLGTSSGTSLLATPSGFLAFERRGPRLNTPGKAEMLTRELRDGRHDLDEFEALFAKRKLKLCELLEAAATTTDELVHEAEVFEREVTVEGVDRVTGRIPAERFIRHASEWTRGNMQLCDKLRLRSTTLRVNIRKVQVQLKAKQELGESLTPVDFEQLRIDNERFLHTIEQKNLQVIELKRMAGDCALQLSVHKKALLSDRSVEDYLRSLGDERGKQCELMEQESRLVEDQNERLHSRLESLRTLTENFAAPPVLEYARICAKVAEQEREMRMWKRRVNLQETALRVACSNLRTSRFRLRMSAQLARPGRPSSEVDDVDCEAFQKFWFGDPNSRAASRAGNRMGARAIEGGDDKISLGIDEEDSWTDIPDTFLTKMSSPKARIILRPCTPPSPEGEEEEEGQQVPQKKSINRKK